MPFDREYLVFVVQPTDHLISVLDDDLTTPDEIATIKDILKSRKVEGYE